MNCNLKPVLIQIKNIIKTRTPVCLSVSLFIFIPEQSVNETFVQSLNMLNLGTILPMITIKNYFFYCNNNVIYLCITYQNQRLQSALQQKETEKYVSHLDCVVNIANFVNHDTLCFSNCLILVVQTTTTTKNNNTEI